MIKLMIKFRLVHKNKCEGKTLNTSLEAPSSLAYCSVTKQGFRDT